MALGTGMGWCIFNSWKNAIIIVWNDNQKRKSYSAKFFDNVQLIFENLCWSDNHQIKILTL